MRTSRENVGKRAEQGEQGSIAPLIALIVLAAGGLLFVLGRLGGEAAAVAQARTAADAAALAGAAEGEGAARAMASANGGRLVSGSADDGHFTATVRVGEAQVTARAVSVQPAGGWGGFAGGAGATGMQPALVQALARAGAALGHPVAIASGWRSPAQQQALWDARASNPYPVARPGTSKHERGLAVDVPRTQVASLVAVGRAAGLCQPLPRTDPIHFELCQPTGWP